MVNSEHELKQFCDENSIHVAEKEHMWGYVIEAYNFLNKKFTAPDVQRSSSNQTSCSALSLVEDTQPKAQPIYTTVSSVATSVGQATIQEVATVGRKRTYHELVAGDNGATINQHILSDEDITLTPVRASSGQSPSKKLVLPCSSARRARLRAIMSKKKAKPAAVITPNKKNASRILRKSFIFVNANLTIIIQLWKKLMSHMMEHPVNQFLKESLLVSMLKTYAHGSFTSVSEVSRLP